MRLLFEIDKKDYPSKGKVFSRPSVRCIAIKGEYLAVIHSDKYGYYKVPGGGIEKEESFTDALIRETKEEAGLTIIKDSIKEYGYVRIIHKDTLGNVDIFMQDNYYFVCEVEDKIEDQNLDDYEKEEEFTFSYEHYKKVIDNNRSIINISKEKMMIERETRVIELLFQEGYFSK